MCTGSARASPLGVGSGPVAPVALNRSVARKEAGEWRWRRDRVQKGYLSRRADPGFDLGLRLNQGVPALRAYSGRARQRAPRDVTHSVALPEVRHPSGGRARCVRAHISSPSRLIAGVVEAQLKGRTMTLEIKPIGQVVAGRTEVADDYWGGVESVIQLDEDEFPLDSMQGLDAFSHLVVVWHFDQASQDDVEYHARHPRGNTWWPATGTFAHRNHRRPNQLAQSFPRLLEADGLRLRVTDLDAVVGTKIYDLSPFFVEMGPRGRVHEPAWPGEMLESYWAEKG